MINSNLHILLANPNAEARVAEQRALEQQGWIVVPAADGSTALEQFAAARFNVVIASMSLPQRDGMEILRQVHALNPETQVILLTPLGSIGSAALGLREGAFAYLLDPVTDFQLLIHTVERAAELQKLRQRVGELTYSPPPVQPPAPVTIPSNDTLIEGARSGRPLEELLHLLAQQAAELLAAPHAAVLLARESMGLQVDSSFGYLDAGSASSDFVETVGDAFAWRVSSERKTLVDTTPAGTRYIGVPLFAGDQTFGALVVYPIQNGIPGPEQTGQLQSLAGQGSLAIALARLEQENSRLSPLDPLTGTFKRAAFLESGDREFRRSWRFDQPITALVIDIDGMHEINARSGTAIGDQVLHRVGTICRSTVRPFDLVSHYDQDAFALLLIMTDRTGARGAAERLRIAIAAIDLIDATGPLHLTTSVGACTYPREGCTSIFDLVDLAQTAQRSARSGGKNQVIFA